MSGLILGLDVSTSNTGIAIIENANPYIPQQHVKTLRPIELTKCKGLWEKIDKARSDLQKLHEEYPQIDKLCIEEPLKNFSTGLSSADVIVALIRFNGIVSLLSRDLWGIEPTFVNASHARKLLGVGVQQTKKVGKNAKLQTFEWVMANELQHITWPVKKSGKMLEWAPDCVDAYVVARSVML